MQWQPMSSAPTDGTRVIVEHRPKHFQSPGRTELQYLLNEGFYPTPETVIEEARFYSGRWQPWCGDPQTQSTTTLEPLRWVFADELRAALEG